MSDDPGKSGWHWTEKLPLLIGGLVSVGIGLVLLVRRHWWLAAPFLVAGAVAIWYSEQIGDWCLPNDPSFSPEWGPEFYHHSLRSCWRLVQGG